MGHYTDVFPPKVGQRTFHRVYNMGRIAAPSLQTHYFGMRRFADNNYFLSERMLFAHDVLGFAHEFAGTVEHLDSAPFALAVKALGNAVRTENDGCSVGNFAEAADRLYAPLFDALYNFFVMDYFAQNKSIAAVCVHCRVDRAAHTPAEAAVFCKYYVHLVFFCLLFLLFRLCG